MNDKDFVMVILDECEIVLSSDAKLCVSKPGTSFSFWFEPGERFYKDILIEWKEREDQYNLRQWNKYKCLYDTACKMSAFFDLNMPDKWCIGEEDGHFMQLTYDEYKCFEDLLAEAIDRGLGLMFNKLKK